MLPFILAAIPASSWVIGGGMAVAGTALAIAGTKAKKREMEQSVKMADCIRKLMDSYGAIGLELAKERLEAQKLERVQRFEEIEAVKAANAALAAQTQIVHQNQHQRKQQRQRKQRQGR